MENIVTVRSDVCKGCSLCVATCPKKIMILDQTTLSSKGYHTAVCNAPEQCIGCAMCAIICPDSAIRVERVGA